MVFFNTKIKDESLAIIDEWVEAALKSGQRFAQTAKDKIAANVTWRFPRYEGDPGTTKKIALGVAAAVAIPLVYTAVGMTTGAPDTAKTFDDAQPPKGSAGSGSKFVAVLSAMVENELNNGWCPSETFLTPSSWRTDTCAFQTGERELISQIALSLRNVMTYNGTRQSYDPDLTVAAGNLQVHPDIWIPFVGSVAYYREAARHWDAYNARLANGKASFPRRVNDIEVALDDIMRVTGDESDLLKPTVDNSHFLTGEDRAVYFRTVGAFRAACELLKAADMDYHQVISNQNAAYSFDKVTVDTCAVADRPIPNYFYIFKSNLNADKEGMAGAASSAIGLIQKARNDLAGGASKPSPR